MMLGSYLDNCNFFDKETAALLYSWSIREGNPNFFIYNGTRGTVFISYDNRIKEHTITDGTTIDSIIDVPYVQSMAYSMATRELFIFSDGYVTVYECSSKNVVRTLNTPSNPSALAADGCATPWLSADPVSGAIPVNGSS